MKYYAGDTIQAKNRTVHAQYEIDQQAAIGSVDRAKSQDMVSPANRIRCGELWSSRGLSLPAGRQVPNQLDAPTVQRCGSLPVCPVYWCGSAKLSPDPAGHDL